ncbi:hypothetical protein OG548_08130 [Streptomyces sp. NBC_01356]|uniref:sigma factor n=1 Tax=Streptomyces sp. NBC_01356 TaxID=2903836 RepID=UPI002E380823|nr:sigma factor [Streptomyces sp. NBC_01356]
MELTYAQIQDAQRNDLAAVTAVIAATESRIENLARKAASRMGDRRADYVDEFTQVGRVAVWEAIPRFQGDNTDSFFAFVHRTVETTLNDSLRDERNGGADHDALKVFTQMLDLSDGDVFLAEKLSQTVPPKGKRLGVDRASAARMAWQGAQYLDAVVHSADGEDDQSSYAGALASSIGIPEEMITAADLSAEDKRVKHAIVHGILDVMAPVQAEALRYSYGISDYECYGTGDAGDLDGMAEVMGINWKQAQDARSRGHKAFAKRYVKAVATSDWHAQELTATAATNLGRGGRK